MRGGTGAVSGVRMDYLVSVLHKKEWNERVKIAAGPNMISLSVRF
jgi:hypothetical protein